MDKLLCSLPKIPQERFNHFIRGYFDGDGCVSYGFYRRRGRNKKTFTISTYFISSSKEFLDNISKKLNAYIDVGLGCISKHTGNHKLSHSKNGAIKLTHYMYKNIKSGLFLERKYKKFQEIFKILAQAQK